MVWTLLQKDRPTLVMMDGTKQDPLLHTSLFRRDGNTKHPSSPMNHGRQENRGDKVISATTKVVVGFLWMDRRYLLDSIIISNSSRDVCPMLDMGTTTTRCSSSAITTPSEPSMKTKLPKERCSISSSSGRTKQDKPWLIFSKLSSNNT